MVGKVVLLTYVLVTCSPPLPAQTGSQDNPAIEQKKISSLPDDIEIHSDTMGVDFAPYLQRTTYVIRKNWHKQIPDTAKMKSGKVRIEFSIFKDGGLRGLFVSDSSGDPDLDQAAIAAITLSSPFSSLPVEFRGSHLRLTINFLYNLNPQRAGDTAQDLPPAPKSKQSLSPFSVPSGLILAKQSPRDDATDSDSASLHGVEILAPKDIKGYDFKMFLEQRLLRVIRQHWYAVIPGKAKVEKKKRESSRAAVVFSIQKDGTFTAVELVESTGDPELDSAVLEGVKSSAPVPLPTNFSGDSLKIKIAFYYNPPKNFHP